MWQLRNEYANHHVLAGTLTAEQMIGDSFQRQKIENGSNGLHIRDQDPKIGHFA